MEEATQLTPELLIKAYRVGYFPMADARNSNEIYWLCPEKRGILSLEHFHVPKRFQRWLRSHTFDLSIDQAFVEVIQSCSNPRDKNQETWISQKLEALYVTLFEKNIAHSIEVWDKGVLVGGLYGIALGGAFFGESMFSRKSNASKTALCYLVDHLRKRHFCLLDCQFINEHLLQFGATEIPKDKYLTQLQFAVEQKVLF